VSWKLPSRLGLHSVTTPHFLLPGLFFCVGKTSCPPRQSTYSTKCCYCALLIYLKSVSRRSRNAYRSHSRKCFESHLECLATSKRHRDNAPTRKALCHRFRTDDTVVQRCFCDSYAGGKLTVFPHLRCIHSRQSRSRKSSSAHVYLDTRVLVVINSPTIPMAVEVAVQ